MKGKKLINIFIQSGFPSLLDFFCDLLKFFKNSNDIIILPKITLTVDLTKHVYTFLDLHQTIIKEVIKENMGYFIQWG